MRSRTKTLVVALAGAVALASAAYGIGSASGGGTAEAGGDRDAGVRFEGPPGGWERGPGPEHGIAFGFEGLADELGVEPNELRQALEDFHERQEGEHRDAFAAALADALGKPVEDVEAALERVAPGERGRGPGPCHALPRLRELAAALDVTPAELREALRELRPGARLDDLHDELVGFLAERFNLSEDEVRDALPEPPRPPRPFGPDGPHPWD
jgi:hypothetical protein